MEYQTTDGLGQTAMVTTQSTSINYGNDFCTDDCHVFGCEHSAKCKCGKATRQLELKKCPFCGKRT